MKKTLITMTLMWLILVFGAADSFAQSKGKKAERMQAVEGEEVWIVVNTIKADKRAQFEKFMFEIFRPLSPKVSGVERKAFIATRELLPTKANEDGTFTYIFLMDPVIKGNEYQFLPLLKRFYGEAKAQEYQQMVDETFAKPQIGYLQKQSKLY